MNTLKIEVPASEAITASYDLVYSTGGSGGPYQGLDYAIGAACRLIRGSRTPMAVYVIDRRQPSQSPLYATTTIRRSHDASRLDISNDIRTIARCKPGDIVELNGEKFVITEFCMCPDVSGSSYMNAVRLNDGKPMRLDDDERVIRESVSR